MTLWTRRPRYMLGHDYSIPHRYNWWLTSPADGTLRHIYKSPVFQTKLFHWDPHCHQFYSGANAPRWESHCSILSVFGAGKAEQNQTMLRQYTWLLLRHPMKCDIHYRRNISRGRQNVQGCWKHWFRPLAWLCIHHCRCSPGIHTWCSPWL